MYILDSKLLKNRFLILLKWLINLKLLIIIISLNNNLISFNKINLINNIEKLKRYGIISFFQEGNNIIYDSGDSILHLAIKYKDEKMVKSLFKNDIKNIINKKNNNGLTPLHLAIEKEDVEIVKLLLKNENIDVYDNISLYLAIEYRNS